MTIASRPMNEHVAVFVSQASSDDEQKKALDLILNGVHSGACTIEGLVKSLGSYLTSSTEALRSRGTLLLAKVLGNLSSMNIDADRLSHFVEFFVARLSDSSSLNEAVSCLQALVQHQHISSKDTRTIATGLFERVNTQALQQSSRLKVLKLLSTLMDSQIDALLPLGTPLISGVVATVDGEKDPRNLLESFSIMHMLLGSGLPEISSFAEELFEVSACYFPITFESSADDASFITNASLSSALELSLCGHPSLCSHTVPFLLSKLSSSSSVAQLASLSALRRAVSVFGAHRLTVYLPEISEYLLMLATARTSSEAVVDATLKSVTIFCEHLVPTSRFSQSLLTSCFAEVKSPFSHASRSHLFLLTAITSASSHTSSVMAVLLPLFTSMLQSSSMPPSDRISLLERLADLCNLRLSPEVVAALLKLLQQQLCGGFSEQRVLALQCISSLSTQQQQTSPSLLEDLLAPIAAVSVDSSAKVRAAALSTLCELAPLIPHAIVCNLLPSMDDLKAVAELCKRSEEVLTAALPRLLDGDIAALAAAIAAHSGNEQVLELGQQCVVQCALKRLSGTASPEHDNAVCALMRASIWPAQAGAQQRFLKELVATFLSCEQTELYPPHECVLLLCTALAGTRIGVPVPQLKRLRHVLLNIAAERSSETATLACKTLASIVNKSEDDEALGQLLDAVLQQCASVLTTGSSSDDDDDGSEKTQRHVALLLWVSRALIQRAHRRAAEFSRHILQRIRQNDATAAMFASSAGTLLQEFPVLFSASSHCRTAVLFRQRWFESVVELLLAGCSDTECSETSLEALAALLGHVSDSVVLEHMNELLPCLLRSLQSGNESLQSSALRTLSKILETNATCVSDQVSSLIPSLSKLVSSASDARARVAALKSLSSLLKLPYAQLYPLREHVIEALEPALDDRKRVVRRFAAACRSSWCIMGTASN